MRLTRDIWEQRNYWFQNKLVDPLFAVNDKRAEAFGISKDSSEVLFARKNFSDYTSWFIAIPPADPGIWRYIFSEAHAHEYDSTKDVHYSGGSILTIHTADGGDRAIVLKNGKKIELQLPANSTTLLDAETGENLMR